MPRKLVLLIFILVILLFILPLLKIKKQIWDLENLLSDISTKVEVGHKQYQIDHGQVLDSPDDMTKLKVLSTAAFYEWDKEDPLFNSPDFDPQGLLSSMNLLSSRQAELLALMYTSQEIYPIKLLTKIAQTANLDKQFQKFPSDNSGQILLSNQLEMVKFYQDSAANLSSSININSRSTVAFNIQLSTSTIVDDLKKIQLNAAALTKEIQTREDCLQTGLNCQRPYKNFPRPSTMTYSQDHPPLLDKNLVFKNASNSSFPVDGPYKASSVCFGWGDNFTAPEYSFYVGFPGSIHDTQTYISPQPATDIYFRKIAADSPFEAERIYFSQGHQYLLQQANSYMCPQTAYLNELGEIDWFLKNNQPILTSGSQFSDKDLFKSAQQAENSMFKSSDPSYDQLSNLADYYGYLYKELALVKSTDQIKEQLLGRYLSIKNKLAYYNLLVNHETSTLYFELISQKVWLRPFELSSSAYPFRSNPSLIYFSFSPSVWKLPDQPLFIDKQYVKNAVSPQGGYISYTQAKDLYSQDEINGWFGDIDSVYESLSAK